MTVARETFDGPTALACLIDTAKRKGWCTTPGCTTCGSQEFRHALRKLPKEEVIKGLRLFSSDFLSEHDDTFRLVILETSLFGVGGELLDPLEGTPAGDQLQANIDYQRRDYERREADLASQTIEVINERRAQRKTDKERVTAPHRDRKAASENEILAIKSELQLVPVEHILQFVEGKKFDVPMQAVGGLIYKLLLDHYKKNPIQHDDLRVLSLLADRHSGYWRKLFNQVSQGKVV
jgi:hypothetical protein